MSLLFGCGTGPQTEGSFSDNNLNSIATAIPTLESTVTTTSQANVTASNTQLPTSTAFIQKVPEPKATPNLLSDFSANDEVSKAPRSTLTPPNPNLIPTSNPLEPPPLPNLDDEANDFPWLNLSNQTTESEHLLSASLPGIGTPIAQTQKVISTENINQLTELAVWGKGIIEHATYSPDGRLIYATTDRGLFVYDAETAEQINFRPVYPDIQAITYLPLNKRLALSLATDPPTIEIIDTETLDTIDQVLSNGPTAPISLEVSTDGTVMVGFFEYDRQSESRWIEVWQIDTWETALSQPVESFSEKFDGRPIAAFAADTKELFFLQGLEVQQWSYSDRSYQFKSKIELLKDFDFEWQSPREIQFTEFVASPNSELFAIAQYWDDRILVVNRTTGELVFSFYARDNQLLEATNQPKSKVFGASSTVARDVFLTGPGVHVTSQVQFLSDSTKIATASHSLEVEIWDIQNENRQIFLENVGNQIVLSPNGEYFAGVNNHLTQWGTSDGMYRNVLKQHVGRINDVQFVPNSGNVAIASGDGFVYLRDRGNGGLVSSLRGYNENSGHFFTPTITDVFITSDGETLASSGGEAFKLWDLTNFSSFDLYPPPLYGLIGNNEISMSADKEYIAVKNYEGAVFILKTNPSTDTVPATKCGWGDEFPLDQPMLVSCSRMCGFYNSPSSIAFSPTDDFLLACNYSRDENGNTLYLWDGLDQLSQKLLHANVQRLKFSKDGSRLVGFADREFSRVLTNRSTYVVSRIQEMYVWEQTEEKFALKSTLPVSKNLYNSPKATISPDNAWIATVHPSQGILFFNLETGNFLHHLPHVLNPTNIDISSDGQFIVVGTEAGTVHLWGVP